MYRFRNLVIWVLVLGIWSLPHLSLAANSSAVMGYAWSSNVGWISMNCQNGNVCATSNYGVSLDRDNGTLSGYAWNSSIGWISFNTSDVAGCPVAPCAPKVSNGKVVGFAKVLVGSSVQGWDGWIHLSGANYTTAFDGLKFTGYSWSDQVVGWISWSPTLGPGVYADEETSPPPPPPTPSESACNDCMDNDGDGKFDWIDDPGCGDNPIDNNEEDGSLIVSIVTEVGTDGKVISAPSGIDCEPTCSTLFANDERVKLTAIPTNPLSIFQKWEGACVGASPVCHLLMNESREVTAYFGRTAIILKECEDGMDNDNDDMFDFPDDPGCESPTDDSEIDPIGFDCPNDGPGKCPGCNDNFDNDGDGFTDWPEDQSCRDLTDNNESNTGPHCPADGEEQCPECNDGIDNDGDDEVDYPADAQCVSRADNSESAIVPIGNCPTDGLGICPQCNDAIDNDRDGTADYAGLDTDKDNKIDIPADPSCQGDPNRNNEGGSIDIIEI